jgi:hypothetical protein
MIRPKAEVVMHRRYENRWLAACLVILCLAMAGCGSAADASPDEDSPATVQPIQGSDRSQVTLTEEAAKRVGIETEVVKSSGAGQESVIPLAAVLYDKDGKTWTYTVPERLTFVPKQLVISRIEGDTAFLKSGPPPGMAVVTVGGAELLGAEYGVSGEQ